MLKRSSPFLCVRLAVAPFHMHVCHVALRMKHPLSIFLKSAKILILWRKWTNRSKNRIISQHIEQSLMTIKVPPLFVPPMVTNTKRMFAFSVTRCASSSDPPTVQHNDKLRPGTLLHHHQCIHAFQSNAFTDFINQFVRCFSFLKQRVPVVLPFFSVWRLNRWIPENVDQPKCL